MYRAYGLTIDSEFALDGLPLALPGMPADICVCRAELPWPEGQFVDGKSYTATLREATLAWEQVGVFRVSEGRRVEVCARDGVDDSIVRLFVIGACMGVLLHQRGHLVLHGSAVDLDCGVVAFIGHKGFGKSTTAAAMVRRGYPLVTDDVLVVDDEDGCITARPGSPLMKLAPEAVEAALNRDPEEAPRLIPAVRKRGVIVDQVVRESRPLRHIFVLDGGAKLEFQPLHDRAALLEVMRHAYGPRFVGSSGTMPEHLIRCSSLVEAVPVTRVVRRPDLAALDSVIDGIIAEAERNHAVRTNGTS